MNKNTALSAVEYCDIKNTGVCTKADASARVAQHAILDRGLVLPLPGSDCELLQADPDPLFQHSGISQNIGAVGRMHDAAALEHDGAPGQLQRLFAVLLD